MNNFNLDDLVIVRGLKNRWGIDCAGTIQNLYENSVDVMVFNINGPGADMLIKNIPYEKLEIKQMGTYTRLEWQGCLKSLIKGGLINDEEMREILKCVWDNFTDCPQTFQRVIKRLEENNSEIC